MSSDLPGVNPATLNGLFLYYRLMTKRSGLGNSTELSRVGLSHIASPATAPKCLLTFLSLTTRFALMATALKTLVGTC
jgi:hypothetical protein